MPLLAWSGFYLGVAVVGGGEGAGMAMFLSVASLVVGTIAFLLYFWKPPSWVIVILTAAALIQLAGYAVVAIRLNSNTHRFASRLGDSFPPSVSPSTNQELGFAALGSGTRCGSYL